MRYLGEVYHEHFICDGLAQGDRKFKTGLLEFLRIQDALHRHDVHLCIRHLYTDGSLAWNRSYDTHSDSLEAQGDVVFKVSDSGDLHSLCRCYLIEGDCRAYSCRDCLYLHTETAEHLYDTVLVCRLLLHVDIWLVVIIVFLEQVESRVFIVEPRLLRVDWRVERIPGRSHSP